MNGNPPQGQESQCKKKVESLLESSSKKLGYNSSSSSPNEPDNRESPTWGSNLMVKDTPDNNDTFDNIGLGECLSGVERFVEEFEKGVVNKKPIGIETNVDVNETSSKISTDEDEEENVSEDELRRSEEIQEDSGVVNYYRQQLEEYKTKQQVRRAAIDNQISSPAQAGIPVTTPKASPVPIRPKKNVKFYNEECSYFETIEETEEQINPVEDSDEEYREWEMRLKRLQNVLAQSLMDDNKRTKSECSRE